MVFLNLVIACFECKRPHNLIGSGTTRRCGFVAVNMALLEEVCHSVVDFEVS